MHDLCTMIPAEKNSKVGRLTTPHDFFCHLFAMTKKTRTADRSRRETQRKSGSSGKLGKKSVTSKDRVVQASKKRSDSTEEPEENGVDQECLDTSDVAAVDDDVSKEKLATHEDAQDNVIQRPTFNIKQGDFVQLTVEMASRLLHANPCCFLTTTTTASGENTCKAPASLNASKCGADALLLHCSSHSLIHSLTTLAAAQLNSDTLLADPG